MSLEKWEPLSLDADILALDLGKKTTGYAYMRGLDLAYGQLSHEPSYGIWKFDQCKSDAELFMTAHQIFRVAMTASDVQIVAYENAINQRARAGEVFCILALAVKVASWTSGWPKPVVLAPKQVKLYGAGNAGASKADVIKAINKRYSLDLSDDRKSEDHNIADAIAVGIAAHEVSQIGNLRQSK